MTITTSITQILAFDASRRKFVIAVPSGGSTVYIGYDSTVSVSTGIPLAAGEKWAEDGGVKGTLFGVVASGTQVISVQTSNLQ